MLIMQGMIDSLALLPDRPSKDEAFEVAGLGLGTNPQTQLMTCHLMASDPQAIVETAAAIMRGELVVFPTDTVYGAGTNAFDEKAILSLYAMKRRPLAKGIPILLADVADLEKVAKAVPHAAKDLITLFWPGPLTLIVPKQNSLPKSISNNEGIAVRIPDNEIARAVIRAAGGAVATSSANRSGKLPAQTADQALVELRGDVAIVLDGGKTGQGLPSTIVDCTGKRMRIVRHGAISGELREYDTGIE
jgi:L-threonylcarbamoyladenylate synthase